MSGYDTQYGRGNDRFITRIEHRHAQVVDRLLGTGGDQDLRALIGERIVALELGDDRVLELIDPIDVRVAGKAPLDRLDAGLSDVRGGIEIRLSGPKTDNVLALGPQARGARCDRKCGRGFYALNASGYRHSHLNFLWFASNPAARLY